jgi:hypothetical protein
VRALCLVRACETGVPDAALWSPEDASWASRLADETVPREAPGAAWLAARARHAVQRIVPRRASLARLAARRTSATRGLGLTVLGGLGLGLITHLLGAGQHINLLAAPLWAVVAWNLLVYLWLAYTAARGAQPGWIRRCVQSVLDGAKGAHAKLAASREDCAGDDDGGDAGAAGDKRGDRRTPEQRFVALWTVAAAPLIMRRAAVLLHMAAIAFALGLLAGLYARALVLDYRFGWQSTLLSPPQVHGLLATLLAPASALTGIAVPGPDAVAALRTDASGQPLGAAVAAPPASSVPWLHLMAATLAWAVGVPRLLLALHAAWQERRAARRMPWPVHDAYARRLLRARRSGVAANAAVRVLPHGFTPSPEATLALRALLAAEGHPPLELHVAAATAYGDEDAAAARLAAAPDAARAACIAWFDLAATPEPQVQGRFVAALRAAARGPLALLVDESAYRKRLGAGSPRLAERRRAWQTLADEAGVGLACIDLLDALAQPSARAGAGLQALEAAWACTAPAPASRAA